MPQPLLVLSNLPDLESAESLARALVRQRLAACVNLLPGVKSIYRWQGALEEVKEVTLMIKTTAARYPELEAAIKLAHPYALPEIVGLPLTAGWPAYLAWVAEQTNMDIQV